MRARARRSLFRSVERCEGASLRSHLDDACVRRGFARHSPGEVANEREPSGTGVCRKLAFAEQAGKVGNQAGAIALGAHNFGLMEQTQHKVKGV